MDYNNITYPLDKIYSNATGVSYPVCGAGQGGGGYKPDYKECFYIENISADTGEFNFTKQYNGVYYSIDDCNTWVAYNYSTNPNIQVESKKRIYLKGSNFTTGTSMTNSINFTKDYNIGGNILSLIDYDNMDTITTVPANCKFTRMFMQQTNLINSYKMNIGLLNDFNKDFLNLCFYKCTSLLNSPYFSNITSITGEQALQSAFQNCTSLVTPPDFSNLTYVGNIGLNSAFQNCTSLVTPPDFPKLTSVGNSGLSSAFRNCTSLVTPPDFSNLTSVGTGGLNSAFQNCTSLVTPPDFSNLTSVGNGGLSSAFQSCTSLATSPDFPNLTSVGNSGFGYAFSDCTSLTIGPDWSNLTSVGQSCLERAFENCSNISTVTTPDIQDLTQNSVLSLWLYNAGTEVTGTKTVKVPTGATISTNSVSGIPQYWTRTDY